MELHFVPHAGCRDEHTSEANVLERLEWEIDNFGRITLGGKTAMSPGGSDVDVLVYNVGIHHGLWQARRIISNFANRISRPLMESNENDNNTRSNSIIAGIPNDNAGTGAGTNGYYTRPKTIYVTTPTQHYGTSDGQWQKGRTMTAKSRQCVASVTTNPRAELEKELLQPGVNVDVLMDYDDLDLGKMHVRKGHDCSHYCMPGVPDVVGARLLDEILV